MADEIINTFGFNVSDALNSLGTLEKRLETTGRAFESLAAVLTSWNAQAAATVGILEKLGAARGFTLGKQFDDIARSAKTATAATSELDAVQKRLQAAANKVFTNTRHAGRGPRHPGQKLGRDARQGGYYARHPHAGGQSVRRGCK